MSSKIFRQSPAPGVIETRGRGIVFDEGTSVPASGTKGYAPGAIFLLTGSPGAYLSVYVNNGSFSSALFQVLLANNAAPIALTANITLSTSTHAGRTLLLDIATGLTATLPAATGTGSRFRFVTLITASSNGYILNTAGSDVFNGSVPVSQAGSTWATAAVGETFASTANKTFTTGGGSSNPTGGNAIGDWFEVQDIATGIWFITGWLTAGTTPTTPFSN